MDQRNFTFLFYGFLAAWLIVLFYVISLIRRSGRLKKELDDVKNLLDERPSGNSVKTRNY
jgi:CcmD family protein